ncbi:hypothetical protein QUC31_002241 [Theobroma cacao]
MGNLVDKTYTGVYHVNVTLYFYPSVKKMNHFEEKAEGSGVGSKADLIIPFLRHLPLNDGLWYEIENATDIKVKEFEIPLNAYRAVLEVYLSFHENDKFWYGNPLNDYIAANNLTNLGGNGPFTEVVVNLDGEVVGVVWPFTVVYTGGINPLLWRPISGFSVTNALNVWYIDANLHIWLDSKSTNTEGKLLEHDVVPLSVSTFADFKGLNRTFITNTTRFISSTGWVKSSYVFMQRSQALMLNARKHSRGFFFTYTHDYLDQGNGTSFSVTNVTLGFGEKKFKDADARLPSSSLRNLQKGPGVMVVKDNLVVGGVGSTQQTYNYDSSKFATPGTKQLKLLHSV